MVAFQRFQEALGKKAAIRLRAAFRFFSRYTHVQRFSCSWILVCFAIRFYPYQEMSVRRREENRKTLQWYVEKH